MDDIYALSDRDIGKKIGEKVKDTRLMQNITQENLAAEAGISLSSVKKIEGGHIGSFDSLIRVLRTLGLLDTLQRLAEPMELSPNEYYEFVNSAKRNSRRRAREKNHKVTEDTGW